MVENVLPDLPYHMNVYAIPKHLRGGFLREHALLGDLSGEAYRVTARFLAAHFPGVDGVPYFVSAVHTFGSSGANPHRHVHALCSLGIKDRHGTFHRAPADLDFAPLEELFRHAVLAMLVRKRRLTEDAAGRFASWKHSGLSVDTSVAAAEGDRDTLHRLACYLLKPPISLERMAYERGDSKVVYRAKPHPARARDIEVYDLLEFLARVLLHIPARWEVRIRYYGAASSTARRGAATQAAASPSETTSSTFATPRYRPRLPSSSVWPVETSCYVPIATRQELAGAARRPHDQGTAR